MEQAENIFTVTSLSLSIKQFVEANFEQVKIRGEVQGVKKHQSGHVYFTLKDDQNVIDAICWKWSYQKQSIQLEDGMEIICDASLTTYPARSKYQIIVKNYKIAGEGALLKLLEERKKKLLALGYFSQKRPIPKMPTKIGVITSETGAVFHDIINRLRDRFPIHVMLWPVLVQGETAAKEISDAIHGFNNFPIENRPDILIIARGGGSVEDLMPFNDELLVKSVFESRIPTISAVGHETDVTLCDYAADLRAATPTAAAELSVPMKKDLQNNLKQISSRLNAVISNLYSSKKLILDAKKFSTKALDSFVALKSQKLDYDVEKLHSLISNKIHFLENTLKLKNAILDSYSFQKTLERGFAIVYDENRRIVKSTKDAEKINKIFVNVADGIFSANVTKN